MTRIDPITMAVLKMKPPRYTITQAARMVDRSPDTLRRWRAEGNACPSHKVFFGKTEVYLYDKADIQAMKKFAAKQRPGRKKKDAK